MISYSLAEFEHAPKKLFNFANGPSSQEELMMPELTDAQKSLKPGQSRLTWNSMGIKEFIFTGNQQVRSPSQFCIFRK